MQKRRESKWTVPVTLAHTKWNCIYHIVFIPKYRRKVMCGEKRIAVR
ncbi:MAG: hypothetical protein FWG40_10530, partial [Peptococcaceae bacterium]|nr:hypothetical protein [Peptococcaceae bacterium]